jgi:D-glycero-alpha-D-manno-heptose-7-phosphate kinase
MIITRTPFRISLFGGGTDYPSWYNIHGGVVIGTTIDKYCYISLRTLPPFFAHKHRFVYSKIEMVNQISDIQHPVIRAVLEEFQVNEGLEIHHDGDLPARSGLGSSSAFTVGLINALRARRGLMSSPKYLADEAIRIEQFVIGENVGSQDQIWAAYGGTNRIEFRAGAEFSVSPIIMEETRRASLNQHMMLFFTGTSRIASEIAGRKIENLNNRQEELSMMTQMVDEALTILQDPKRPISEIGALTHESWLLKRSLADGVSTPQVDEIYDAGRAAGALGGKLLGAGGGGFILFFAKPEDQQRIRERLKNLVEVTVNIGSAGSKVVVYEPSGLESS